jgi:hypothetical protein
MSQCDNSMICRHVRTLSAASGERKVLWQACCVQLGSGQLLQRRLIALADPHSSVSGNGRLFGIYAAPIRQSSH